jgi:hypothetical protein
MSIVIKNKFQYPKTVREAIEGHRHYAVGQEKLPSVTTVLGETKDKKFLEDWKKRVGEQQAEKIKNDAAARGSVMHHILEEYIIGNKHVDLTSNGKKASVMAQIIIDKGLSKVDSVYGIEAVMHYPGLYAGSADLVGVHQGEDAIMDFKQTNKPKQEAWIGDYFLQLAAYGMAHDYVYGTKINKGVIMMCSIDNYYQEFIVEGEKFKYYKHEFLRRLDQYYGIPNNITST